MEHLDSLGRRSRYHRQPKGRPVRITPRVMRVFQLLNRYHYLRATYIHAFIGGERKDVSRKLGTLYHEGYLDRPEQQWQTANADYLPVVSALNERSKSILRSQGFELHPHHGEAKQFFHDLMACEIMGAIELACIERGYRFIPWHEILTSPTFPKETRQSDDPMALPCKISHSFKHGTTHTSRRPVMPDGVFGIEYAPRSFRFFALEADRSSEPLMRSNLEQTSYLRKFLQYREVMRDGAYRKAWGLPNLLILNVTINHEHQRNMETLLSDLTDGKGATYFLFKTMPELASFEKAPGPELSFLTEAWKRVGHEPLNIGER